MSAGSKQTENSGGRAAETATQGSPFHSNTGEKETEGAWSKLATEVWTYEETRVKRWKDEISNLLIFAGLFSAVLTAFTSQYYTLIQLGPANFNTMILERQTQIFERMASQLANLTAGAIVQVSNTPVMTVDTLADPSPSLSLPPFPPRWVATLWFVSLVFSLSAASVALTVNQWLNFHAEQAGLQNAPQKLWVWRLRRQALNKWKVEFIVSLLPLLLQIALVLFLLGMIGYLGEVGPDISRPSTVCISILFFFLIATSTLPAIVEYSPYKSPQAFWILRARAGVVWAFCWILLCLKQAVKRHQRQNRRRASQQSPPTPHDLRRILDQLHQEMEIPNWLGHEQMCLHGTNSKEAEKTIFSELYSISSDPKILGAMDTCLEDISVSIAMENAAAIGNARIRVLPRNPVEGLQYDMLDRRITAPIGRLVLDTFIRKLIRESDHPSPLENPANCYMVAKLFRAMPDSDAKSLRIPLFRLLDPQNNAKVIADKLGCLSDEARGGSISIRKKKPLQRKLVDLIHTSCLPKDLSDLSKLLEDDFPFHPREIQDWYHLTRALLKSAFSSKPDDRDYAAVIHMSNVLLVISYGCSLGKYGPYVREAENYIREILLALENDLATWSRENMGTAYDAILYEQVAEAGSTWNSIISAVAIRGNMEQKTRLDILQSFNHIARWLQWLLVDNQLQLNHEILQGMMEKTRNWATENKQPGDWEGHIQCAPDVSGSNNGGGGQANDAQTSASAAHPGRVAGAIRTAASGYANKGSAGEIWKSATQFAAHVTNPNILRKALGRPAPSERADLEALPGSTDGGSNTPNVQKPAEISAQGLVGDAPPKASAPTPPLQRPDHVRITEPQPEAGRSQGVLATTEPGPSGDRHGRAGTPQNDTRQDGAGESDHMRQGEATSERDPEGTGSDNERRGERPGPKGDMDHEELVAEPPATNAVAEETNGDSANDSPGSGSTARDGDTYTSRKRFPVAQR